jgi:2-polyprenyl-3-methyl-5-hydroxy-6-metoxy-1,4-benzoquinol methylase
LRTGQGRNAIYLAAQGWTVTGVDLSEAAIDAAKKMRRLGKPASNRSAGRL